MNLRILKEREVIQSTIHGLIITLYRLELDLCGVPLHRKLQEYWERECNATEKDLYKTDGAIRASKQTR